MFDTPILFLIFVRPDLTQLVFERIKEIKPARLFIAADGPRKEKPKEVLLCEEARKLVLEKIDWPCEVKTLFRESNLGSRIAVSEAITWFFDHVEEGIILEDDCLPNKSFFIFCKELLYRYKTNDQIFHISGNNFQFSAFGNGSYYLSKIPHIWGWATWRRAWQYYNVSPKSFNEKEQYNFFPDKEVNLYLNERIASAKIGNLDAWDYQWLYTLFAENRFALQPQYNLVKNIGFDIRSNTTSSPQHYLANLKTYDLDEIIHPEALLYDEAPDLNFVRYLNWKYQVYADHISGTTALKTFAKIIRKKLFSA